MKKTPEAEIASEQQTLYDVRRQEGVLQEFRLFGSPGTGKTTTMSAQINNAVTKHGSDRVVVASFTRTAAAELVGRGLPIPKSNIATLHAHAYRALGRPELLDVNNWNRHIGNNRPDWMLSSAFRESSIEEPDMPQGRTEGDKLLSSYELTRAKMIPVEAIFDEATKAFATEYEGFKKDNDVIDFTDMISLALQNIDELPQKPTVGFFDETQDFTPLELSLVRKWGAGMEFIVLAGDDDQTLFSFKGATPTAFLQPEVGSDFIRVLPQSYRVPAAVHRHALEYIEQIKDRQFKKYMPRFEVDGYDEATRRRIYNDKHIANGDLYFKQSHIQDKYFVESLVGDAVRLNEEGKTAMFLTACSYQLDLLRNMMRNKGVAFHNPFRTTNGSWNPLAKDGTLKRIATFIYAKERRLRGDHPTWTVGEFLFWADLVNATGVFKRGQLSKLKATDEEQVLSDADLDTIFHSYEVKQAACAGDFSWLQRNCKKAVANRLAYLLKCIDRYGFEHLLTSKPKIVIGTIHSVKGGEADHVFLSPDLSYQGYQEYLKNQDATIRQMYVGMTRAFEALHILTPSTNAYARIR